MTNVPLSFGDSLSIPGTTSRLRAQPMYTRHWVQSKVLACLRTPKRGLICPEQIVFQYLFVNYFYWYTSITVISSDLVKIN